MSIEEHLIENAIIVNEHQGSIDEFLDAPVNQKMLMMVHATGEEIFAMANYVVFTYKPWLEMLSGGKDDES